MKGDAMKYCENRHPCGLGNSYHLRLSNRITLRLHDEVESGLGDSSPLQKGLTMYSGDQSLCGEGVGFGVPAIEYVDQILFSTSAKVESKDGELVKYFSIDTSQSETWRLGALTRGRAYHLIAQKLTEKYRRGRGSRTLLRTLLKLKFLVGFKLSYCRTRSRGIVEVCYSLSGNAVNVRVNLSRLADERFRRVLVFNEQSAEFSLYRDEFSTSRGEDIGVWEEVDSGRACLTNESAGVTFCVKNIDGAKLLKGRESFEPRLDWSGFCYVIPSPRKQFQYAIEIAE
jgi:hypothetical protein